MPVVGRQAPCRQERKEGPGSVDIYLFTNVPFLIETAMEEDRGVSCSKVLFLKGLVDFEEADAEPDPRLLWNITWQEVKRSLASEIKEIARRIEG